MTLLRTRLTLAASALAVSLAGATPAAAQFFFKSKSVTGAPVRGDEDGMGQALPGATPAEVRAALIWNMRAALNVAALQCQFEQTLPTVYNYNAILVDHRDELKGSFDTLNKYFLRIKKTKAAGQTALDQFGTRSYSAFATVAAQFGFCQTAATIGRDAVFQPRGKFGDLAELRTQELRNSLVPYGEQQFAGYIVRDNPPAPRLDPICWDKKGNWVAKKCGALVWPPQEVASR